MAARWTAGEHSTLIKMLVDGVTIQSLKNALPSKSEDAILTRARNEKLELDFRTSKKDGRLYKGVKRRNSKKKDKQNEDVIDIIGTSRTATTALETLSEQTTRNVSETIIAQKSVISSKDEFIQLCGEMRSMLESTDYPSIQSIEVVLESSITVSKEVSHEA